MTEFPDDIVRMVAGWIAAEAIHPASSKPGAKIRARYARQSSQVRRP